MRLYFAYREIYLYHKRGHADKRARRFCNAWATLRLTALAAAGAGGARLAKQLLLSLATVW